MSLLEQALELAKLGFHIFPITPGRKAPPAIKEFPTEATRSPDLIKEWWVKNPSLNIGISTSRFGDNEALVVVDVDNKGGKDGAGETEKLKKEGFFFPPTFTTATPSGLHYFYRVGKALRQGVDKLAPGIDIRSQGGYVVGVGSVVDGKNYTYLLDGEIALCPEWIIKRCGDKQERQKSNSSALAPSLVNSDSVLDRAIHYLMEEAPLAIEGASGDETTLKVFFKLRDFGIEELKAIDLAERFWNKRNQPPWNPWELAQKARNAYRYASEPLGKSAPQAQFDEVKAEDKKVLIPEVVSGEKKLHPFDILNSKYAYLLIQGSGCILKEIKDECAIHKIKLMDITSFDNWHASWVMSFGSKTSPVTKEWMKSEKRRSYEGLAFMPGQECPKELYNLWRGFRVEPYASVSDANQRDKNSLTAFVSHAEENICKGDKNLTHWLLMYFAHMIQRPWELPCTALVLRGKKGVGKNALLDRVGYLLGDHFDTVSSGRYLTGNFNAHLENKLMLVFDEAFWSGDKAADSILKSQVTASFHRIERKGHEVYNVTNCLRTCILGNEDWVVPASHDERRYAVFNVGEGKKQNTKFFREMREGMEAGGYRLLLRFLLDYDISNFEVAVAPVTDGLSDQKDESLHPFYQWWKECLWDGYIPDSEYSEWPNEISKETFSRACYRAFDSRRITGWRPTPSGVGQRIRQCLPSLREKNKKTDDGRIRTYVLPHIDKARKEWDAYMNYKTDWPIDEEELLL